MKFYIQGGQELVFEENSQYPMESQVELMQVSDRSAGGTLHVETYAEPISGRTLNFDLMSETDYTGLLDWFLNIVNGAEKAFMFEDERGMVSEIRIMDKVLKFPEISYRRYSGKLNIETVQK